MNGYPKVHIEEDFQRDAWVIYVVATPPDADGRVQMIVDGGNRRITQERGEAAAEYARVEDFVARAIVEKLDPRPNATGEHLADAISVRDRLLTLFEGRE